MAEIQAYQEKQEADLPKEAAIKTDEVDPSALVDWTPQEERRAVWKLTMIVMPLIMLGFFSLQLDRGNITSALTGTLFQDVGIDQDQLNSGQSLLLVMIVLFEVPSNLILVRIGAKWWLSGQMIAWGTVATAQCAIRSPAAFYVTRMLLGICESGFIPGSVYYLSTLVKRSEQSRYVAWFYIGNIIGKGSTGLLGSVFLKWQGKHGLPGWAWIYLVEGIISIFIGFLCLVFLPDNAVKCKTLLGFRLFTERESHILHTRVILDDPLKAHPHEHFTRKNVAVVFTRWRLWCHSSYIIAGIACVQAVGVYNAQVVKSLGFTTSKANALSSVGSWLQAPVHLFYGHMMDYTRFKGPLAISTVAIMLILNGSYYSMVVAKHAVDKWSRYALYQLMIAFGDPFCISGLWWLVATARTPLQRSMYSAMFVMSSNSGQAIGQQIFRKKDAPKYITGFSATLGIYGFVLCMTIFLTLQYFYSNKHNLGDAGKEDVVNVDTLEEHDPEQHRIRAVFKYPT